MSSLVVRAFTRDNATFEMRLVACFLMMGRFVMFFWCNPSVSVEGEDFFHLRSDVCNARYSTENDRSTAARLGSDSQPSPNSHIRRLSFSGHYWDFNACMTAFSANSLFTIHFSQRTGPGILVYIGTSPQFTGKEACVFDEDLFSSGILSHVCLFPSSLDTSSN